MKMKQTIEGLIRILVGREAYLATREEESLKTRVTFMYKDSVSSHEDNSRELLKIS
jgi:hypothetical protein